MKHLLITSLVATMMAACSTTSPDVVQRGDAQRLSQVQDAVVLSVRTVTVDGTQSGVGAVTGGVVGGVAGSSVGGSREGLVVGVIGAVAGAVVGNVIERSATREASVELLLRFPNGDRRALIQAKGDEDLQAGDAVILVTTGGKTRVTRAPGTARPRPE